MDLRKGLCFVALSTLLITHVLHADDVKETSFRSSSGEGVLRHEIIIAAPPARVWEAFTTTTGLRNFAAPVAAIDLRIGGTWEASYDRAAGIGDPKNIQNEILAYVPNEMLTIRIKRAPPTFPHLEIGKAVWTVILLHELPGDHTRVEVAMLPWKDGESWNDLYAF